MKFRVINGFILQFTLNVLILPIKEQNFTVNVVKMIRTLCFLSPLILVKIFTNATICSQFNAILSFKTEFEITMLQNSILSAFKPVTVLIS